MRGLGGVRAGIAMAGALLASGAMATLLPAGPVKPVATFTQAPVKKGAVPKLLYYKNEDVLKTTSVTTKTPIYTTVYEPVYMTIQVPVKDSRGRITYQSQKVQTGTVAVQKITGYNTVVTKSTKIMPKAELYSTNGTSTSKSSPLVNFSFLETPDAFASLLTGPQSAVFTFSAVSNSAATLAHGTITQTFDSGSFSFKRATPIYKLNALGQKVGGPLDNLLTVTFTNAAFMSVAGGTTMSIGASSAASAISFSSDFMKFTSLRYETAFDFSLTGVAASAPTALAVIDPTLTNVTGARTLASFRSSVGGLMSASVPEPSSWATMLAGFGLIGATMRSRGGRKLATARVTL